MNKIVPEAKVPSYSKLLKFYISGVCKKKKKKEIPELENVNKRFSLYIKNNYNNSAACENTQRTMQKCQFYDMYVCV